jgi:diguanylate cyclase (GGDEF)-like protein/PAS domain S-box-containing protein
VSRAEPARSPAPDDADLLRLRRVIRAQRDISCAATDSATVFRVLADSVLTVFPAEGAIASQPEGDFLVARAAVGSAGPAAGHRITLAGTLGGRAVRTLTGQLCRDSQTDPRTQAAVSASTGTRSSIIVPLVYDGVAVGVIGALSSRPEAFDEDDLALLTMLADVASSRLAAALAEADIAMLRADEGLRRARDARLRAGQELTGLAWWELDPATGQHVWSEAMFRLVGLPPSAEPPDDDAYLALIHPDDRPAAVALRQQGFSTGHRDVYRVVHPDGAVRHLQAWTDVERDAQGAVVKVVGATIDVTEREELLASLDLGQANLAAALELTRTGTWELDVLARRLTWSERMFELMDRDPSSPPPGVDEFLASVHPDDTAQILQVGMEQVASGIGQELVYRVPHRDGSVRHVQTRTDVRRAADGTVTHLWGTATDVTAQAEAAARLRASEEHFRVAFDNAPIGMSMVSLAPEDRGSYLRTNAAFEAMLGWSSAELSGTPLTELTHPDDRERDSGLFLQLATGETQTVAFEKRYLHRNGSVVHAWMTSTVVHDTDGQPLYLVTHALDLSDRLREQAELERLALTDTLTGLANRTLLNDRLDQSLARLQRTGGAMAMLLLDVDRFKTVNDSLGHQVGDALLVEVASRLEAVTRADATVARLGGDEFVVLIEGLPEVSAVHGVAGRLLEALRRPYALGHGAEALVTTTSMGISVATDPARTPGDLYREADLALYRAKDAGRDQYALYDDELRARADRRMAAETLLRKAISENLLVPVFQPIVDLSDGRVRAAEALVRIQDGDRLVLPAEFIDVAEETGLIVEVDGWMFERVAAECARLLDVGGLLRRLTTNVSARSLEDPTFVGRMRKALTWFGVPGSMIRVELTERSLLTTSPVVEDSLARIQDLGVEVGLDDFGTGYSALAYLQRFSLHFLKIDRSFVSRLGNRRDDAVVGAVIDLAHAHDLVVIGEGVETQEQLDALRRMGCDRAQGYLMGRPMPAGELDALLRTNPSW